MAGNANQGKCQGGACKRLSFSVVVVDTGHSLRNNNHSVVSAKERAREQYGPLRMRRRFYTRIVIVQSFALCVPAQKHEKKTPTQTKTQNNNQQPLLFGVLVFFIYSMSVPETLAPAATRKFHPTYWEQHAIYIYI